MCVFVLPQKCPRWHSTGGYANIPVNPDLFIFPVEFFLNFTIHVFFFFYRMHVSEWERRCGGCPALSKYRPLEKAVMFDV